MLTSFTAGTRIADVVVGVPRAGLVEKELGVGSVSIYPVLYNFYVLDTEPLKGRGKHLLAVPVP